MHIKTRNLLYIVPIIILTCSCHAGKHSHGTMTMVTIDSDSVITDVQGNSYLLKKMADNKLWMTNNLKLKVDGSYCYDNMDANCDQYGRLYTWESAMQVCGMLGDEWRLPTTDDWQQLAALYAGKVSDSIESRKNAYHALLQGGNVGFNAILGGGRRSSLEYARLQAHGFYWTATTTDSATAWFANFAKGSQSLYHQNNGEKSGAFSVRCLK